jgi:hypothetical protein
MLDRGEQNNWITPYEARYARAALAVDSARVRGHRAAEIAALATLAPAAQATLNGVREEARVGMRHSYEVLGYVIAWNDVRLSLAAAKKDRTARLPILRRQVEVAKEMLRQIEFRLAVGEEDVRASLLARYRLADIRAALAAARGNVSRQTSALVQAAQHAQALLRERKKWAMAFGSHTETAHAILFRTEAAAKAARITRDRRGLRAALEEQVRDLTKIAQDSEALAAANMVSKAEPPFLQCLLILARSELSAVSGFGSSCDSRIHRGNQRSQTRTPRRTQRMQ